MKGNLENNFEELLDKEALRIMHKLLIKYERQEKVNRSFWELIQYMAKDKYKYFYLDIAFKIKKLLPEDLEEDITKEYALVTKEIGSKRHLKDYEMFCQKNGKSHKKASKELANMLVKYCLSNPDSKKDLIQLVVQNISMVMPTHHDSVDCRVILMYLQQDINSTGYTVINLAPLRIIPS